MARRVLINLTALSFAAALAFRFHDLGGPYLEIPETIQDHVARERYPSRDAIVMSRRAERLIRRGATLTVLMPSQAPNHDPTLNYTAVGLMPHHRIIAANLDLGPEYVVTIREPLSDPRYQLTNEFPEGKIYQRR